MIATAVHKIMADNRANSTIAITCRLSVFMISCQFARIATPPTIKRPISPVIRSINILTIASVFWLECLTIYPILIKSPPKAPSINVLKKVPIKPSFIVEKKDILLFRPRNKINHRQIVSIIAVVINKIEIRI